MREFSEFKVMNHMDRVQAVLRGELPAPVTLELDPTNECIHNCIWCIDAVHRHDSKQASLPGDLALQIISDAKVMGVRSLVIKGGGEPLIYPHITELLTQARRVGLEVGVITNGEMIIDLKDVLLETCSWIRISLDAGSAETHQHTHRPKNPGSFDKIWQGIHAVADKLYCGIIYIIHPATFHEMAIAAKRAKAAGCRYIGFKRVVANRELFDTELYMSIDANYLFARRQYQDENFSVMGFRIYNFTQGPHGEPYNLCLGHHLVGIVAADGGVYACCSTRGRESHRFGSVYEKSLPEIWHCPKRREVLQLIADGRCRNICLGHTSYMRYDHYNNLFEYIAGTDKPHGNFL